MRVYIPSTPAGLAVVHAEGGVGPAPLTAYTVTPALREWYGTDDEEELEYGAMAEAAAASLRAFAAAPDGPARRAVLAADVPDHLVTPAPEEGPATVTVAGTVPRKRVASVHLDAEDAAQDVRAAAAALAAAEGAGAPEGDAVEALLEAVEEHELLWYATQELGALIADQAE